MGIIFFSNPLPGQCALEKNLAKSKDKLFLFANACPALGITLGTPYFHVLCDGLLLDGKTTAISKSRYYAWKTG